MDTLDITTNSRIEFVDITHRIQKMVDRSKNKEGICLVFCPHTTAGLTINENADKSVCFDINKQLQTLIPKDSNYQHQEGNSDSHIKTALIGNSVSIIINAGKLVLGTWQGIFFCEFDGPRSREVYIKIVFDK